MTTSPAHVAPRGRRQVVRDSVEWASHSWSKLGENLGGGRACSDCGALGDSHTAAATCPGQLHRRFGPKGA